MSLLNKLIVSSLSLVPKLIVGYFAKRYIAGDTFDDAARAVRELNASNMMATVDLLGEDVTRREEAIAACDAYKKILSAFEVKQLDSNLSVKLTQLGLKLDRQFCADNLVEILEVARKHRNFVRIDMEDSTCTDDTLEIYRAVRRSFDNVGVVIQAYMRRSEADVWELIKEKANVRLCKGIYVEPAEIALQGREEVRENFLKILDVLLRNRSFVGIATHDDVLINAACEMLRSMKFDRDGYEFQMLFGVRHELRSTVVQRGHRMRIYVPFGRHWYPYSMRRLKENPQIARYIIQSIFTDDRVA